jgi:hypothetical protein
MKLPLQQTRRQSHERPTIYKPVPPTAKTQDQLRSSRRCENGPGWSAAQSGDSIPTVFLASRRAVLRFFFGITTIHAIALSKRTPHSHFDRIIVTYIDPPACFYVANGANLHAVNRFIAYKRSLKTAQLSNFAQNVCTPAHTLFQPASGSNVTNFYPPPESP